MDYDGRNPIYQRTQEDDVCGVAAALYYRNLFGWTWFGSDKMRFVEKAGYCEPDANIDFYDTTLLFGSIGIN